MTYQQLMATIAAESARIRYLRVEMEQELRKLDQPKPHQLDEVIELSIQVAGHLSTVESMRFRDMAIDAWYQLNINQICAEVEGDY